MVSTDNLFPPTATRFKSHTRPSINRSIKQKIMNNVLDYKGKNKNEIRQRLHDLDHEWDTERVLEANFASIVLLSSILGLTSSKMRMLLSGITSIFMIQHAFQGWCPPLSIIRRLGVRTTVEINKERIALQNLLENEELGRPAGTER